MNNVALFDVVQYPGGGYGFNWPVNIRNVSCINCVTAQKAARNTAHLAICRHVGLYLNIFFVRPMMMSTVAML